MKKMQVDQWNTGINKGPRFYSLLKVKKVKKHTSMGKNSLYFGCETKVLVIFDIGITLVSD